MIADTKKLRRRRIFFPLEKDSQGVVARAALMTNFSSIPFPPLAVAPIQVKFPIMKSQKSEKP
jgi:hypothetical protein